MLKGRTIHWQHTMARWANRCIHDHLVSTPPGMPPGPGSVVATTYYPAEPPIEFQGVFGQVTDEQALKEGIWLDIRNVSLIIRGDQDRVRVEIVGVRSDETITDTLDEAEVYFAEVALM